MSDSSSPVHLRIGDTVRFSKTVSESDIYLFAGITGDFAPMHVDEQFMQGTPYGRRIAHGALLIGYMSACSTLMTNLARSRGAVNVPVSQGYDRVRFVKPVFIADTLSIVYTIESIHVERGRASGKITVTSQRGETVAVADHILKWVSPAAAIGQRPTE